MKVKTRTDRTTPKTIDGYIARFPPDVQRLLKQIRRTIRKAAPDAEETIKYQIPTLTLNGILVSFAAYKNHIGLYPVPRGLEEFRDDLAGYAGAKSTARFALDEPIPVELITRIVRLRAKKNLEKTKAPSTRRRR